MSDQLSRRVLYALSIQNEPDWDPTCEGCVWTGTQMRDFLKNNGAGMGSTPVIMPESFHFDFALSDPTLNDPAAAARVSIVGGHPYGGTSHRLSARLHPRQRSLDDRTLFGRPKPDQRARLGPENPRLHDGGEYERLSLVVDQRRWHWLYHQRRSAHEKTATLPANSPNLSAPVTGGSVSPPIRVRAFM